MGVLLVGLCLHGGQKSRDTLEHHDQSGKSRSIADLVSLNDL